MPLYDYKCAQCGKVTEVRHGFNEGFGEPCPDCGGALVRVFNPAPIVFKGSGFYATDSRKSAPSGGDGASEKKPAEAKSDAKPSTGDKPSSTEKPPPSEKKTGDAKPSGNAA